MNRREENSGLIDLDALMKQAASPPEPQPWQSPPPARADDSLEGLASAPSSRTLAATTPERAAESTTTLTAAASYVTTSSSPSASSSSFFSRRRRNTMLAGLAAAALAALVVVRVAHAPGTESATTASLATPSAPPSTPALRPVAPPAPTVAAVAAVDPNAVDPNALPVAAEKSAPAVSPRAPSDPARAAASPKPAPGAPAPDGPAKVTESDLAAVAGKDPGDLGDAMRYAVGPRTDDKGTSEANAGNGARQLRPSPGAVVGAINSVLPAARACLGPDDAVRSGSLVFRSDGSVASVDLRGSKAEDACVRTALSKARVEAFADDTFTTRVTVRP